MNIYRKKRRRNDNIIVYAVRSLPSCVRKNFQYNFLPSKRKVSVQLKIEENGDFSGEILFINFNRLELSSFSLFFRCQFYQNVLYLESLMMKCILPARLWYTIITKLWF